MFRTELSCSWERLASSYWVIPRSLQSRANEVARLCKERGITQYELAKRSQLQESSVRNMFQKGTTPTYRTLSAICGGLGITVPQFFTASSFLEKLPPEEKELMTIYLKLDEKDRSRLLSYARRIFKQNEKETTL